MSRIHVPGAFGFQVTSFGNTRKDRQARYSQVTKVSSWRKEPQTHVLQHHKGLECILFFFRRRDPRGAQKKTECRLAWREANRASRAWTVETKKACNSSDKQIERDQGTLITRPMGLRESHLSPWPSVESKGPPSAGSLL